MKGTEERLKCDNFWHTKGDSGLKTKEIQLEISRPMQPQG